jgi:prepilin-type N-terminal cleavage/methylation domain-containing protein
MKRYLNRRGFTLIEVMAALVILGVVIVGMVASVAHFLRVVGRGDRIAAANELVEDRIEQVKMEPKYAKIDSIYAGTETNFPTLAGYARRTTVVQVGGPTQPQDYKIVTVVVTGPGLDLPAERTVVVGSP